MLLWQYLSCIILWQYHTRSSYHSTDFANGEIFHRVIFQAMGAEF